MVIKMENNNVNEIINLYFKSLELFKNLESTPRDFGSGNLLFKSEVHTLSAIGFNPGINLTSLAAEMSVSKSAVSKFVRKLLDKHLIQKYIEEDNKKEVIFYLTDIGKTVFEGHEAFKKSYFSGIYELLAQLKQEEKIFLTNFLKSLNQTVKKSLE
jgi:DNA-binding MarR family transcriptional regulator